MAERLNLSLLEVVRHKKLRFIGVLPLLFSLYSCDLLGLSVSPFSFSITSHNIRDANMADFTPTVNLNTVSIPSNLREYWAVLSCDTCSAADTDLAFWADKFNADPTIINNIGNTGNPNQLSVHSFSDHLATIAYTPPLAHTPSIANNSPRNYILRVYAISDLTESTEITTLLTGITEALKIAYDSTLTARLNKLTTTLDTDTSGFVLGSASVLVTLP